jgi:hypothetical protein
MLEVGLSSLVTSLEMCLGLRSRPALASISVVKVGYSFRWEAEKPSRWVKPQSAVSATYWHPDHVVIRFLDRCRIA